MELFTVYQFLTKLNVNFFRYLNKLKNNNLRDIKFSHITIITICCLGIIFIVLYFFLGGI
jgi:hypothetical protein